MDLKRLIDTCRYDWLNEAEKRFSFKEFRRGLEWFSQTDCPGCHYGGGAPCGNRACASTKQIRSCLECAEYNECPKTIYQRHTYPQVIEHNHRVTEVGLDKHLEEEAQRALAGVNLMSHLERRYCKNINFDED